MSAAPNINQEYRQQLKQYAESMAVGMCDGTQSALAGGFTVEHVKLFTDGNLDKRFEKLNDSLELLKDVFDDLENTIADYVRTVPLSALDTGSSDADRFLRWLPLRMSLTPVQDDYVICVQQRHAVEEMARHHRQAHIRFQERSSVARRRAASILDDVDSMFSVNPIRSRAEFRTLVFVDEQVPTPAPVVFFACEDQIRTALLDPSGVVVFALLEQCAPVTISELWCRTAAMDRREVSDFVCDSAQIGLLANC